MGWGICYLRHHPRAGYHITQIITNLISNAVKYTECAGRIRVCARVDARDPRDAANDLTRSLLVAVSAAVWRVRYAPTWPCAGCAGWWRRRRGRLSRALRHVRRARAGHGSQRADDAYPLAPRGREGHGARAERGGTGAARGGVLSGRAQWRSRGQQGRHARRRGALARPRGAPLRVARCAHARAGWAGGARARSARRE